MRNNEFRAKFVSMVFKQRTVFSANGNRGNRHLLRPLINDFLRKMAKFRHQENQDVSAGTRIRFFIDKPAAMISFPRAVIKYL